MQMKTCWNHYSLQDLYIVCCCSWDLYILCVIFQCQSMYLSISLNRLVWHVQRVDYSSSSIVCGRTHHSSTHPPSEWNTSTHQQTVPHSTVWSLLVSLIQLICRQLDSCSEFSGYIIMYSSKLNWSLVVFLKVRVHLRNEVKNIHCISGSISSGLICNNVYSSILFSLCTFPGHQFSMPSAAVSFVSHSRLSYTSTFFLPWWAISQP